MEQRLMGDEFYVGGQGPADRRLRGDAGHGHRCAAVRESGVLQGGVVQDQILADDRAWDAAVPRPVWAGPGQGVFLRFRLLREPGVFRRESRGLRGAGTGAGEAADFPAVGTWWIGSGGYRRTRRGAMRCGATCWTLLPSACWQRRSTGMARRHGSPTAKRPTGWLHHPPL